MTWSLPDCAWQKRNECQSDIKLKWKRVNTKEEAPNNHQRQKIWLWRSKISSAVFLAVHFALSRQFISAYLRSAIPFTAISLASECVAELGGWTTKVKHSVLEWLFTGNFEEYFILFVLQGTKPTTHLLGRFVLRLHGFRCGWWLAHERRHGCRFVALRSRRSHADADRLVPGNCHENSNAWVNADHKGKTSAGPRRKTV